MLLPPTCPVCRAPGPAPCAACAAGLPRAPALPAPPAVDRVAAVLAYEGAARGLVAGAKYRNRRSVLPWLATAMAALVRPGEVDVVTWAPTTPARRRARGFDQAELLARRVAALLGLPCRRLLRRRQGPPQTGRTLAARRTGPSFAVRRPWAGGLALGARGRVLVVDDVVTSGATATAAALALRQAGASAVVVVAAARTPARAATGGRDPPSPASPAVGTIGEHHGSCRPGQGVPAWRSR